jgi:hypothetical protein
MWTPPINPYPDWDPIAHLQSLHTKQIMNLRNDAYLYGHKQVSIDDAGWMIITIDQINEVLKTREHIPNKAEAKKIRQFKMRATRHR